MDREVAFLTLLGKLFKIFGDARANERSPAVFSLVFGTLRILSQLERKDRLLFWIIRRSRRYFG